MMLRLCATGLLASAALTAGASAEAGSLGPLPASFTGTLPCADCPGIEWQLDLLPDGSFQLRQAYLDRGPDNVRDDIGRWAVGGDGRRLVLAGGREAPIFLEILSPEDLRLMDREARPIESELPYNLRREDVALLEPRLIVSGMYSYLADSGRLEECTTGRTFPVAMTGDNAALERAYLEARSQPGEKLRVTLEARVALLPPMEGAGLVPTVEPLRFIGVDGGEPCPPVFRQPSLEGTEARAP